MLPSVLFVLARYEYARKLPPPKVVLQRSHSANAIVALIHRCDDSGGEYFAFRLLRASDPPAIVPTYRTLEAAKIGCDTELGRRGHRCSDQCGAWTGPSTA